MASLITVKGPNPGRRFPLVKESTLVGRQPDASVYLESLAVSRQHACIRTNDGNFSIEDLGSSNGTFVNGHRIRGLQELNEGDRVQIGPYTFALRIDSSVTTSDSAVEQVIQARVGAHPANQTLYQQNPTYKLQVVLEIAQHLGQTLELDPLLHKLLEQLLRLFPQADQGMVLLWERDRLVVRAQRSRQRGEHADFPYSRSLVQRALEAGEGLLSQDVGQDQAMENASETFIALKLRSFLCVPLITRQGRRLGVIQLDSLGENASFREEDLELLTAVSLQVTVVLENAALHAARLREERLRQEVMMARDIQQAFLPTKFQVLKEHNPELYACVHPAREVSGDLYDFFPLPDGRLGFFLGDVSGKGMPAALFMIMVRTLSHHLISQGTPCPLKGPQTKDAEATTEPSPRRSPEAEQPTSGGAADFLHRLNKALVKDNPTELFVTMLFGIYDGRDGTVFLSSGGHPPPLLRHANGEVETVSLRPSLLLGYMDLPVPGPEVSLTLQPGDTLILYTDGLNEATRPDGTMYATEGLSRSVGGDRTHLPLDECVKAICADIQRFTQQPELQDDQTLLLLRHPTR